MAIVYDGDEEAFWVSAGCVNDGDLTLDALRSLTRLAHICCDDLPDWVELPEGDGAEFIGGAG